MRVEVARLVLLGLIAMSLSACSEQQSWGSTGVGGDKASIPGRSIHICVAHFADEVPFLIALDFTRVEQLGLEPGPVSMGFRTSKDEWQAEFYWIPPGGTDMPLGLGKVALSCVRHPDKTLTYEVNGFPVDQAAGRLLAFEIATSGEVTKLKQHVIENGRPLRPNEDHGEIVTRALQQQ